MTEHDSEHGWRHLVTQIEYAKPDAVTITCSCGFSQLIGVWYEKASPGWDKVQWPEIIKAVRIFLDSLTEIAVPQIKD